MWLNFNEETCQFSGSGPQNLESYHLQLLASDGINDPVSDDSFILKFYANPPELSSQINNLDLELGKAF